LPQFERGARNGVGLHRTDGFQMLKHGQTRLGQRDSKVDPFFERHADTAPAHAGNRGRLGH